MESVIQCTKAKDWTNPKTGQTVPIYQIGLSDGRRGQSFGKEIPIGTPVSELIIEDKGQYGLGFKLKSAGGGFQGKKYETHNETFALSYAKDLVVGGKVDIKNILSTADKLYAWLEGKKAQAPTVTAASLPPPGQTITKSGVDFPKSDATDDLPF
jgi:hypothetical protein